MVQNKSKVKNQNEISTNNVSDSVKPVSHIWQDERFQHLVSDPRFKNIHKKQKKVKIDERFQGMFNDDKFTVKYTIDKYGRKVKQNIGEDLKKYYELSSSANEESEDEDEREASCSDQEEDEERLREEKALIQEQDKVEDNDALVSDGEYVPTTLKERLLDPNIDYARGEGRLLTDSSSDEESTDDACSELSIDHVWGELDNDADTTDKSTQRLAVCNMDWDRIRAVDLMMLFSSFLPPGGSVLSVKIYPSEFGKQRMADEDKKGPQELVNLGISNKNDDQKKNNNYSSESEEELVQEQDSDADEGDEYHMEKLRKYQLNRLRYYYAVVECDSIATADKIYRECDGIEYESSATRVDLRFIPDDTIFDDDEVTDICNEMPDIGSYKPRQFTTTALQQVKVNLTWDETALDRRELGDKLSSGHLDGLSEKDLRKIVAYSSEEEEVEKEIKKENDTKAIQNDEENMRSAPAKGNRKNDEIINKYKALLAEINEKEIKEKENKKYEMEFTWEVDDKKGTKNQDKSEPETNENSSKLTPIEKALQKRSEKNKKRKEERKKRKLLAKGIDPSTIENDSDIDSIPDDIDMNDPYFAEEFENGNFMSSSHSESKATHKKQKKLLNEENQKEEERQYKELELLLDDDDVGCVNSETKGKQHFSLDKIMKAEQHEATSGKRKKRKQLKKSKSSIETDNKSLEDNFEINVNDERFKAMYESADFNIDPTHPRFKKTKNTEKLIHEQLKRRHENTSVTNPTKKSKEQVENNVLIKNLKRKIQLTNAN